MNKIELQQTNELTQACQIIETLILRTKPGGVLTIEVGENLLSTQDSVFGGKFTLQTNPPRHIGFCEAANPQEIGLAVESLNASAIIEDTPAGSIPRPHVKPTAHVSA